MPPLRAVVGWPATTEFWRNRAFGGFPRTRLARLTFGDGSPGEVRRPTDIPVGLAGNKEKATAFALDVEISDLLRKGALEALGGQLDVPRDISTLRKQGATNPVMANRMDSIH